MSFTTRIKDEITKTIQNDIASRIELLSYMKLSMVEDSNKISLFIENASVARYIFKLIKQTYNININLTIRLQKKFNIKRIFILSFSEKINILKEEIKDLENILNNTEEEMSAYLKGAFLCSGSINDPSKSKYHLEFLVNYIEDANLINKVMHSLNFNSKVISRDKGYMVYLKASEEISDFIKLLGANNSLFYYEDIRIYRDHKNMVNRLNNCEQANIEKSMKTCKEQLDNINYLIKHDLIDLLDDKIKLVIEYRIKYPETTMNELANIISLETENKVSKSCINHYFRKIKDLVNKSNSKNEN